MLDLNNLQRVYKRFCLIDKFSFLVYLALFVMVILPTNVFSQDSSTSTVSTTDFIITGDNIAVVDSSSTDFILSDINSNYVLLIEESDGEEEKSSNIVNPVIENVTIAVSSGGSPVSAINLIENGIVTVYIHGSAINETGGCKKIDESVNWEVVFFRTNISGMENCIADNTNCYHDIEEDSDLTDCGGGGDNDIDYEMDIGVYYYADATDVGSNPDYSATTWTANVEATNDQGKSGSSSATTEINTLKALNVTSVVDYGTVNLGSVSVEQTIIITNTGNDNDLDPAIHDSVGWLCTIGTLSPEQVHWNIIVAQGYQYGTEVTSSTVDLNDFSLQKTIDGSPSTKDLYTMLKMPDTGIGGECFGSLIFTAA